MTTDPTAGGTTDPTATQTEQQQIDAALSQAEQAVADLTNRVGNDLQSLRDQVAKLGAQGTVDVTEIVNRIDQIVVNVQGVDPSVVVQGGSGGPLPPAETVAYPPPENAGQTPAGATAEASDVAPEGEAASGEQGEQVEPGGGPSAGQ